MMSLQNLQAQEEGTEKVVGAFGITLGQIFNLEDAVDREDDDGDNYWFAPDNPYDDFIFYSVARTPITGVVAMITAYSEKMTKNQCEVKRRTLKSILYRKYPYGWDARDDDYNKYTVYGRDPSYVKVNCEGFGVYRLVADYYDLDIRRILKDERTKLDIDAASKDGL